jgi:penicillin-insensitive murein DD-endopeptidase
MSSVPSDVISISASVGRKGANRHDDILAIQRLLNIAGAGIDEDGDCGRATISAIEDYQRNWVRRPDGLVEPRGMTWSKLVEAKFKLHRQVFVPLPQLSGNGYYSYASMDRQYGTAATVTSLVTVCRKFMETFPDVKVAIGDMSFMNGARMRPHETHRNGRNADIRPVRSDGKRLPVAISDSHYSRERTKVLIELLRAEHNLKAILFNDIAIPGVKHWVGHHNHLHVSMHQ